MIALFCVLFAVSSCFGTAVSASCVTPNGETAECISVYDCAVLYNNIRSSDPQVQEFIKKSFCGYADDGKPAVCCGTTSSYEIVDRNPIFSTGRDLLPDRSKCGFQDYQDKILNGVDTGLAEYPWMALLQYVDKEGSKRFNCGGSLISSRYVLTAAHCFDSKKYKIHSVRLGEWNTETSEDCVSHQRYRYCSNPPIDVDIVDPVIRHESYRKAADRVSNDIALIRLKTTVNFSTYIQPICLPLNNDESTPQGSIAMVSGWGTTEKAARSAIKQKLAVPVVALSQCKSIYSNYNYVIGETQLCAGGEKGKDSCKGDSGGPLISTAKNATEQHYIEGIVSFGAICGTEGIPGVYTKVSAYLDWIHANIRP